MACWVCAVFCIVRPPFFVQHPNPTWRCALSWNRRWSTDGAVHSCGEKTKALAPSKGEPLSQVCVSINHALLLSHSKTASPLFPFKKWTYFDKNFHFCIFKMYLNAYQISPPTLVKILANRECSTLLLLTFFSYLF